MAKITAERMKITSRAFAWLNVVDAPIVKLKRFRAASSTTRPSSDRWSSNFSSSSSPRFIVKKPLYEEASTKKPEWLLGAGFLTSPLMGGGFSVI
jgi:hypothetical protein